MPVYNGGATLRAALDSLLAQSFSDFVLVISDNGSTDDTEAICREYVSKDTRLTYFRQPKNLGAAMNFRYVLFEAKSPYFMWAAADDLWAETFVERNLDFLDTNPDYVMSQSRVLFTVRGTPSFLATGTYAMTGSPAKAAVQYFTNPADNSRYYGLFRTAALQSVFPPRSFYALDWAVSAATLKYGKHHEVQDVLMIRDSSDPLVYERAVLQDHKSTLLRIFPLLFMTLYILRHRQVAASARLIYVLFHTNIYLHFRFGMYRWKRLAERYLQSRSVKGAIRQTLPAVLGRFLAPGMRGRLRRMPGAIVRSGINPLRFIWARLPLDLEQRFAVHRFVNRHLPWLAQRLLPDRGWRVGTGSTGPATQMVSAPDQSQALAGMSWRTANVASGVEPKASVVLIACDGILATLKAIDSLLRSDPKLPLEILLINQSAPDVTKLVFPGSTHINCINVPQELSFGAAANRGIAEARSDQLIFIDNNMYTHTGFVESLIAGLSLAAMVAPQVRTLEGRLITSGGKFNSLSQATCVGYLQDPGHPNQQVSVETDFCFGAIAINRQDCVNVGCFDESCTSLEQASANLAVRLRRQSRNITAQPSAVLTSALDTLDCLRRFSPSGVFHAPEWIALAQSYPRTSARDQSRVGKASTDCKKKHALYIDADTPTPDQNAGSLLALNLMRIVLSLGYDVTFIPENNFSHRGHYTEQLQYYGIRAVWHPYFSSVEDVVVHLAEDLEVVYLCRGYIAEKYTPLIRRLAPRAKIVFNTVDLHFLRMQREAHLTNDDKLMRRAEEMRKSEFSSMHAVDATIVVSSYEKELLDRELPDAKVHLITLINEISDKLDVPGFGDRKDMMFVGTFQHPPNRDAAIFFATEIFPLVRRHIPEARFIIAGSALTPDVAKLAGNGIEVLGFVEDLDSLLNRCRISVAPLRFGAGIKGKVATALQAGLPTVATPIAVEGTPLLHDFEILIANKPEDFAEQVVRLYLDNVLWERLSIAGFAFVQREYSFDANRQRLRTLLTDIDMQPPIDEI